MYNVTQNSSELSTAQTAVGLCDVFDKMSNKNYLVSSRNIWPFSN